MKGCASIIVFFITMGVCTTAVKWFYTPHGSSDPVMIVAGLVIPFLVMMIFVTGGIMQEEREKREQLKLLELQKEVLMLQQGQVRDDSRLPPEYLKAFEKAGGENGQAEA